MKLKMGGGVPFFSPLIDWCQSTAGKYYSMYFIIQDDADVEVS